MVVAIHHRCESFAQEPLSAELGDETHLDAGQLPRASDHVDTVTACDDGVVDAGPAGESVDKVDAECAVLEAELACQRELRVGIDDEDPQSADGERHADVRCGRGLSHAALLVCDDGHGHEASFWSVLNVRIAPGCCWLWCSSARRSGSLASRQPRPVRSAQ
jgi:hypothetical protein